MSKDAAGCQKVSPEEEAEIETVLSEARVEYLRAWRKKLLGMRTQIDDLLEEIEKISTFLM